MKEIQSSTHAALRDQGEQMRRIETDMDKVGTQQPVIESRSETCIKCSSIAPA
jgi:hypothetical protein